MSNPHPVPEREQQIIMRDLEESKGRAIEEGNQAAIAHNGHLLINWDDTRYE